MNAPYSFNFKYDPILENPFRSEIDYNKEIDERVRQLQLMKDKYNSTVKQTTQSESLWNKIDNEIKSLNDDQRNILFNDKNYISIDTQLKILVQEALVNSVKNVIENSEIGNKLLTQQLNLIKTNKDKIIAESNRELETFKKFQIAAQANPNLTYKEFCENINNTSEDAIVEPSYYIENDKLIITPGKKGVMVNKDELINKLVEFLDIKLTNLSKDDQLVNVFIRPIFSRIINNNIGKVNQALSIIADENGMIDADGILNDMIDNLIISPVKEERGIKIGAGNVEIKIPFINKAIALDKDDINEFKEMLSKIQQ